jgi:hypothetical protein
VRGEGRLILGACRAGGIAAVPAVVIAFALRGTPGALAAVAALGIVVANLVVSGAVLFVTARRLPDSYPMIAMPSYALRMAGVFAAMGAAYSTDAIDPTTFSITFAAGLIGILAYECVLWARTPWLALEFAKERP